MLTAALLAYATVIGSVGVRLLRGGRWLEAAPRAGILVWLVLSGTIPLSILAASLSILSATSAGHSIVDLLHACITALRTTLTGSLPPTGATLIGVGLGVIVLRIGALFAADLTRGHLARGAHRSQLRLVASRQVTDEDLLVVDHPLPLAFCLPGRTRTVVVTSATVASLSADELTAVLAHERAHLRGRHHLVLAWSRAVARGLPFLPDLRLVTSEQARLVEMAADDRAALCSSPQAVATALLRLVDVPFGVHALYAVHDAVSARVARLLTPTRPTPRITTVTVLAAFTVLSLVPAALVSLAWIAAARAAQCPID